MPPPGALLWSGLDLELAVFDSEGWVLPPLGALSCAGLDLELDVLIVRVGSYCH